MKHLLSAAFVAVTACTASAAFGQAPKIKFTEYDLPNGLHVILHRDNSVPVVATTVMYHVGAKNEARDRTGFAHFFEHLLFEGSPNLKRGEYMRTIRNAGGELNANTTSDRTFYYEVLPSNQLELALYMESERMLHSKVDLKGVETQREVVKEERRLRYDNRPYGTVFENMFDIAYTTHPYKVTTIGKMEHLNKATLPEFIQFYKDFYVPNNAILSIAGDIDEAKTKLMVARYFGEIPKSTKPIFRPSIKEPEQTMERRDTVLDNITLPAVVQAFHIPAQGTADYYAINLLTYYLSGGESSLLQREVADKQEKAVQVAAFPISLEDPGLFGLFAIANQGVAVKDLEESINTEMEKVRKDLISERDFQKTQNIVENDFISQNNDVAGIAENLAQYKMYFGDANLINTELDRYKKVTREDLRRVAQKYLIPKNRSVIYVLPKPSN
jgi:zinc protease